MDPFTCFGIIVHIGMILGHMHFYADVDFLLCNGFRCFLKVRVMEYFFGCRKIDFPCRGEFLSAVPPVSWLSTGFPSCFSRLLDIFLRAIDFEDGMDEFS